MPRKKRSKGLGDSIENITKATGVKKVVDTVSKAIGVDCGCSERKEFLNRKFPYINKKESCMNEEQIFTYEYLKETYLSQNKSSVVIKGEDYESLIDLYNSVFQTNITGCKSCELTVYFKRLEKVYNKINGKK